MILVELFSKDECHLCEQAKAVLEKVRGDIPFTLKEIKISPGDAEFESYKESVPVVLINHEPAFRYTIDEETLRRRLRALKT